jgi:hypothetical protein
VQKKRAGGRSSPARFFWHDEIWCASASIERGQERSRSGIVAEGFAHVRETIDVSRREDETAAELKGILAKFVLMMPGRFRAIAALEIVASG